MAYRILSENTATEGSMYAYWGSTSRSAQRFTVPAGYTRVEYVNINIRRAGTPGNLYCSIYTDNGGKPGTIVNGETSISYSEIGTTAAWKAVDTAATVTPGGTYWLVTRQPSSTSLSNAFFWDSANSGSGGKYSTNSGSTWSALSEGDWSYQIYGYGPPSGMAATTTSSVNNTSLTAASDVTDDMGYTVSSKGFCYSSSNANPTLADSSKVVGSGIGAYSTSITGLLAGTTYYIRSYATNAGGTSYGPVKTQATTYSAPTVTTGAVTSVDKFSATLNGNITSDNGSAVTERGFVYSTTTNPLVGGSGVTKQTVTGTTGAYLLNATSLSAKSTYYVKAYATNAAGTSYGGQVSFETLSAAPSITSTGVTSLLDTTVTLGGNVTSDNGATVTERGVVYNINTDPTIYNSKVVVSGTTGVYTGDVTGLTAATTYYYRAYATNSYGTSYGESISFRTEPSKPTAFTGTVVGKTRVDLTWTKGIGSTYTIIRRATGSYPATPGSGTSVYSGVSSLTSDTGLSPGTTYYYRAWGRDGANNDSTETADIIKTTDYGLTNPGNAYAEDSSYATAPANDSKIYVRISKDGGTTWSPEIVKDLPVSNGTITFGSSSSVLWGQTLTGDDIDDTSFRVLVTLGSNKTSYQIFKNFGFSITSTYVLTGLEINIKGYFDTDTSYIDGVSAKCYYGTSVLPVKEGAQAYDSTTDKLAFYDGSNWKQLLTSDSLPNNLVTTDGTQTLTNKTINVSNNTLSGMLDWFYPVGTIYETTSTDLDTTTKMNAHFGGTWEVYGSGQFLVAKSADTEFDTIGETGGEKTVTLTASQSGVPQHTHTVSSSGNHTHTTGYESADHTHNTHVDWSMRAGTGGYGYFTGASSDARGNATDGVSANHTHSIASSGAHTHTTDNNTAANAASAHTNLPPYIVVYRYRRTA